MQPKDDRPALDRQHLETARVARLIDRVEAHRVVLGPLAATGLHVHTGGTIGYILDGEVAFQIEGEEQRVLRAGDAFVEPAGRRIERFDNLSDARPATFLALYPLAGEDRLITPIDSASPPPST
jgi:quercetin dioxygenase-like cupin family protein